jgi:hypothetical protein
MWGCHGIRGGKPLRTPRCLRPCQHLTMLPSSQISKRPNNAFPSPSLHTTQGRVEMSETPIFDEKEGQRKKRNDKEDQGGPVADPTVGHN